MDHIPKLIERNPARVHRIPVYFLSHRYAPFKLLRIIRPMDTDSLSSRDIDKRHDPIEGRAVGKLHAVDSRVDRFVLPF